RTESEVIILKEHERRPRADRVEDRVREAIVGLDVGAVVLRVEVGSNVDDMAEWPQAPVREAIEPLRDVVRLEPDSLQGVVPLAGRHLDTAPGVRGLAVGVPLSLSDPRGPGRARHGIERGGEAAGAPDDLDSAASPDVLIGFALRRDDDRGAARVFAHASFEVGLAGL